MLRSLLVPFAAAALKLVVALPSPQSVGSDLTLLFQNDLNWTTAPLHPSSILISDAVTNAQALSACQKLNENLLTPSGQFFNDDITNLLKYQALINNGENKQFWIGSSSSSSSSGSGKSKKAKRAAKPTKCSAISVHGTQSVSCNTKLQALCAQSAPYRRNTATDLSEAFQVQIESNGVTFMGTRDKLSFRFIGIPYANPVQRFAYSTPSTKSSGSINALNYGSPCLQLGGSGNEDCLFLNIYTPFLPVSSTKAKEKKQLKPVMFWIHGGGFTGGEGSDAIFDGGNLVTRSDVVVVTINYRLGSLGFLALNDGVTNGNFGIADQITALQWVHSHIASFGGDPSRVTIFGQSAGAGSVRALLASPPSFGLYAGAIAQSNLGGFGYAHTYTEWMSISDQFTQFAAPTIASVGCGPSNTTDVLGCLRKADGLALQNAPLAPRYVVQDGKIIKTPHLMLNGAGPAAPAHVVFGWMRDDGADFIGSFPTPGETVTTALEGAGLDGQTAQKAVGSSLFPMPKSVNTTANVFNLTSRIGTDGQFLCIDQATLVAASTNKIFPSIWSYQFDKSYAGFQPIPGTCVPPATAEFPNGDPSLPYYRCHSGELYYNFGTLGQDSQPFRDANDLLISQVAVDAWGAFARTFNPNPTSSYLSARGYSTTAKVLETQGKWNEVLGGGTQKGAKPLRIMDVPFSNVGWREVDQCSLLGFPTSMFLKG
ncbi:Alpha/Beta hydrolase protein [Panaeolus papilionaceus]|nr:Alpha/Beta hydrolase protein [Panaeolus papilionaceus]